MINKIKVALKKIEKIPLPDRENLCFDEIHSICTKEQFYEEIKKINFNINLLERMQEDMLHLIEFTNFDAYRGFLFTKLLHMIRKKRRAWKNRQKSVNSFRKKAEKYIELYLSVKNEVGQINKNIENQKYMPRALDLFWVDVN